MRRTYLNAFAIGLAGILLISTIQAVLSTEDPLQFTCQHDTECKKNFKTNSTIEVNCVNGLCRCTQLPTGQLNDCMPLETKLANNISGPCPCTQKHSACDEQQRICVCVEHFMASADLRRCLHSKHL